MLTLMVIITLLGGTTPTVTTSLVPVDVCLSTMADAEDGKMGDATVICIVPTPQKPGRPA